MSSCRSLKCIHCIRALKVNQISVLSLKSETSCHLSISFTWIINNMAVDIYIFYHKVRFFFTNSSVFVFSLFVLVTCPSLSPGVTFPSLLLAGFQKKRERERESSDLKLQLCHRVFNGVSTIWKRHEYVASDILHHMNVRAERLPGRYEACESVPLLLDCAICI